MTVLDPALLWIWDASNRLAPWAWFPFGQPPEDEALPRYAAGLYVVHGLPAVPLLVRRSRRTQVAGALVLFAGWALFTGAWNRRAARVQHRGDRI